MALGNLIHLTVVTPYREFINSECDLVELNTHDGSVGIMYGHTPVIMALTPGLLRYRFKGEYKNAFVSAGYATIHADMVTVIANAAEWPSEIEVERAKQSLARNLNKFNKAETLIAKSHAKHAMRRARARLHIANVYNEGNGEI